jgi:hypothetical protein
MTHRLALPCLLAACAVGAPEPTPQKVIDEYLQAQGGANAVARIRTETIAGNLTEESTGKTGSWSLIARAPDRFYTEIIAGPDRTVEAYNGMSAWGQDSSEGARTLTGDAATQTEAAARYWNERLADVKKPKLILQFMGIEKVRGRDTWHIRVSSGPGMTRELYFDAGTHLIAREVLPNLQLDYDDYRPVQGIQTPYRIELRRGGHAYKIAVTRAEFDSAVDDSVFNFPRTSTTPLPDIDTLIREVTKNQKAIDELQKQYTCHLT